MKYRLIICMAIAMASCNKTEITVPQQQTFRVVSYMPAPGQFINSGYSFTTGKEATDWAQNRLEEGLFVSLGSFGGYIVVEASPEITNAEGYDFCISGNTFDGNSEPGVVWVSSDGTSWFQLKGQDREFYGYSVTYHQTEDGGPGDILWEDNEGNSGKVTYLPAFHKNSYFPMWVSGKEYTLSGTRLENRMRVNDDGIWETGRYMAGYADNLASDMENMAKGGPNRFDISDAIGPDGEKVDIPSISFIKVQSAVIAPESSPVIGEVSTEVTGFSLPSDNR